MYNKFTVTVIVSAIIAFAAILAKSNNPQLHAKETVKPAQIGDSYTSAPSPWCPVVGDGVQSTGSLFYNSTDDDGVVLYKHCKSCNTGVYSERENGLMLCTFCSKGE